MKKIFTLITFLLIVTNGFSQKKKSIKIIGLKPNTADTIITTEIFWRNALPFKKNYKIRIKKNFFLSKNYRRNYYKTKGKDRINDSFKDTLINEVIKTEIYKLSNYEDGLNFYYEEAEYSIILNKRHDYTTLLLKEIYQNSVTYYNITTVNNTTPIKLSNICIAIKTYKLKPYVIYKVLEFLNSQTEISKNFTKVLLTVVKDTNSTKTTYLYNLSDLESGTLAVNSYSIGSSFFNNEDIKTSIKNKADTSTKLFQYIPKKNGTSNTAINQSIISDIKDERFKCNDCDDDKDKEIYVFNKNGKDIAKKDTSFNFKVLKINENQFWLKCKKGKDTDSILIDNNYPSEIFEQVKQMGEKLWSEDTSGFSFSHSITDRVQAAIKVNYIKIKTKDISDSLISTYEIDFGKAGLMGLKTKKVPLYDVNGNKLNDTYLIVNSVHILADYNRIDDITINGELIENGISQGTRIISNSEYGLSFYGLNNNLFTIGVIGTKNRTYTLKYSDVVYYKSTKGVFSYMVKTQEFILCVEKKKYCYELDRRSIYDYLSLRVFLDPFAFLSKNANGLSLIEGNILIPSRIRNYKQRTWFNETNAKFDYIIASSTNVSSSNDRQIKGIVDTTDTLKIKLKTINKIDNLDLLRKYTYKFDYYQSILQLEQKALNQFINFELGFVAIGARTVLFKDSLKNKTFVTYDSSIINIHKFMPSLRVKGSLRPDAIFGLNWSVGLMYSNKLSLGNNNFYNSDNPTYAYSDNLYSKFVGFYELNFYTLLSKSKANGLYFRHNGYLTYYSVGKFGFFPQILVGYATNINNLVKTFTKNSN